MAACASRRPSSNGRAEVTRSAVESGTAVGDMRVTLARSRRSERIIYIVQVRSSPSVRNSSDSEDQKEKGSRGR